jgi:catechol 2,3-dioxygenase-like lactoylglutathione lyase family enzyme
MPPDKRTLSGAYCLTMLKIVGILHHAVQIDGSAEGVAVARHFYGEVIGLPLDGGRPDIPGTPGWWFNIPEAAVDRPGLVDERPQGPPPVSLDQIHLIGAKESDRPEGSVSAERAARLSVARRDHIALAVEDLREAKEELTRHGVQFYVQTGAVGAEQVFFQDPFGNVIELQEAR